MRLTLVFHQWLHLVWGKLALDELAWDKLLRIRVEEPVKVESELLYFLESIAKIGQYSQWWRCYPRDSPGGTVHQTNGRR